MNNEVCPRLSPHYVFRWEASQDAHILLYPEGLIKLNPSAGEILKRCDGQRSVDEIAAAVPALPHGLSLARLMGDDEALMAACRPVARELGLVSSALYRYFEDGRQEILLALARGSIQVLDGYLARLRKPTPPADRSTVDGSRSSRGTRVAIALSATLEPGQPLLVAAFSAPLDDPSTSSPIDTPLWHSLERVVAGIVPGSAPVPMLLSGATDARFFRAAGVPSYGFSPFLIMNTDTLQVDQANERFALPGFVEGVELYEKLVRRLVL